jgi:hypothetical protein
MISKCCGDETLKMKMKWGQEKETFASVLAYN